MSVTDLQTGQGVTVEQKPLHQGMVELLAHAAAQIAEARAFSRKLALAPDPGVVMGALLAANLAATEALVQAMACAYNMVAIGANSPMQMHKVGVDEATKD